MDRGTGRAMGWIGIVRLGCVQASIGAIVMLATSLLNRLMVLEYGLAAAIPAGLVAWHYLVQLSRPMWGHRSDQGRGRVPWIRGGMAMLALGALAAVDATILLAHDRTLGLVLATLAFAVIGAGVGAAGTSLLALLASSVAPQRRAAAAAVTWIMMVFGIVLSAGLAGALLDPFTPRRLALIASGIVIIAFAITMIATHRLESDPASPAPSAGGRAPAMSLRCALGIMLRQDEARRFTLFIFLSMLAYSMQDLILEPFAGLVFGLTPGQSTSLSGMQHGGVLIGMIVSGLGGSAFAGRLPIELRGWTVVGCVGSALSLCGLAMAAQVGPAWPLVPNVFLLGLSNGVFAVAAIGSMMGLAGAGGESREGMRMGVWGMAQAIAFGLGGLIGAVGVDLARRVTGEAGSAFELIFASEAMLFLLSALLLWRSTQTGRRSHGYREARA